METKNWWDGITEANIQILKDNKTPLGLMPEHSRGVFDSIERSLIQYYCNGVWRQMTDYIPFSLCYAYRLNPNWQKPEPKKEEGHWEYFDILEENMNYFFHNEDNDWKLHKAFSMVGFGGIEFEECSNCWFMGLGLLHGDGIEHMQYDVRGEEVKPATPKRVRFWMKE